MPLKTREQVRQEFASRGWSYSDWARQRGYSAALVCMIVNDDDRAPQRKCLRGESHNIAVELKLKDGVLTRATAPARMALSVAA